MTNREPRTANREPRTANRSTANRSTANRSTATAAACPSGVALDENRCNSIEMNEMDDKRGGRKHHKDGDDAQAIR
jgi:hypothetical protein